MMTDPFRDPDAMYDYNLRASDLKLPQRKPAAHPSQRTTPSSNVTSSGIGGLIERVSDNIYRYHNIPYAGSVLPTVELTTNLLDGGKSHTLDQWLAHKDNDDFIVPDVELLYQIMHANFAFRDDAGPQGIAAREVTEALRKQYDDAFLMTATKVSYGNKADIVLHQGPGTKRGAPNSLRIPETRVLVLERTERELATKVPIVHDVEPALEQLLGTHWESAPNVFQYTASRNSGKLREARLWTPSNGSRPCERVVCLGVYGNDRFYLNADGSIDDDRPALGVRPSAPKNSGGNKGAP